MSRVALVGENSIEYVDALLDIWNNGDCAVLLDWRIPLVTAIQMMQEADVHKCYIEKKQLEKAENCSLGDISFITFEKKSNSAELLPQRTYNKFKPNYTTNEAIVLYSSGTTGQSKGIILSHFAINTNADAIIEYMNPTVDDCIYIAKTLAHSSTLTGELLVALKSQMKLVIAPPIVPPRFVFSNITKFRVSIICLNPTLLSLLADEYKRTKPDISTIRTIYVSGSVLNDKIYEKAHSAFKSTAIHNVYGLSEAGPRVSAQTADCCKSNSVGKPLMNVEVAIVDENGKELPIGERGIVHVKTQSQFSCYIHGREKCKSLYHNWLNTGDVGYIDNNEELHITDRVDDVIIIDSHKIYPSEVEKQILIYTDVDECVVLPIEKDGNVSIECVYTAQEELDIRKKLINVLMACEVPCYFRRVKEIPKTNNGKISRLMLEIIS